MTPDGCGNGYGYGYGYGDGDGDGGEYGLSKGKLILKRIIITDDILQSISEYQILIKE